jgi:peptide/nickel transport system permease protein
MSDSRPFVKGRELPGSEPPPTSQTPRDEEPAPPAARQADEVERTGFLSTLLWGSILAKVCTTILLLWVVVAIVGPLLLPLSPYATDSSVRLQPPDGTHWLGTDEFGRDVFTRVVVGARISLIVGLATVSLAAVVGTLMGVLAGFYRWLSGLLMRFADVLLAFPGLLLALVLVAVVGRGVWQMIVVLGSVYAPLFARVSFGEVRALKEMDYVQGAKVAGCSDVRILSRHVIPAMTSSLTVQASFVLATAIIFEASLSFVGAGVPSPEPSWGAMVSDGRTFMRNAPWLLWPPAIALTSLVLAVSLLGDRLRDILDPKGLDRAKAEPSSTNA